MEQQIQLYAVQNYERTRLTETLFFTEWDDAIDAATHKEPSYVAGFDYTLIAEFAVDEDMIDDIRMNDTEALLEIFERCRIKNQYYYI